MKKTSQSIEKEVITLIALGERYASISIQTGVPVPTIKKIRKRNLVKIEQLKARAVETQAQQISTIIGQTNAAIKDRLDQGEADERELEILSSLYREGEIGRNEYYKRKRLLHPLTIRELLMISEAMHQQVIGESKLARTHDTPLAAHLSS